MDIQKTISQMTIEQKLYCLAGADGLFTVELEQPYVPKIQMRDGPHGVRKTIIRVPDIRPRPLEPVVCFPTACATASSFNTDLMYRQGQHIAKECHALDVDVILGPGINIKRSALGGRNFEYFSEDPVVSAKIGSAFVDGCQSEGVGTSLKHFALNNQELYRLSASAEADKRTIHELYLYAFEQIVKKSQPWTIMAAYNRINGVYATQNRELLEKTLREKWGFEGLVMSDWGAVSNRVEAIKAGCDLEMPTSNIAKDELVRRAYEEGRLTEEEIDRCLERFLTFIDKCVSNRREEKLDLEADHAFAKTVADECIVLLKNEENILPLSDKEKIAVIGGFAKAPRVQAGGSSKVNPFRISAPLDYMGEVSYAEGYSEDAFVVDEALIREAVELAKTVDKAVIFAGLPDGYESEGMDRDSMSLPAGHDQLISAVAAANPNTVVVLMNGSSVEMPWADEVKGIVESYLCGQAVGESVSDILYGKVNPSGKLAETFPLRIQDDPAYINAHVKMGKTFYNEGVFVGYRYYDYKEMPVRFPFGHGLSYTEFEYSDLKLSADSITDQDTLTVTCKIKNVGKVAGKEAVQLYVRDETGQQLRPIRELKEFTKVALAPGEVKEVSFTIDYRAFAWFSTELDDFYASEGTHYIEIGASSRDIRLSAPVQMTPTKELPMVVTVDTPMGDLLTHPRTRAYANEILEAYKGVRFVNRVFTEQRRRQAYNAPLRLVQTALKWTQSETEAVLEKFNQK